MGRAAAHSRETIFAAADALAGEGKAISAATVREKLGGVGSFTTLARVVEEWRNERRAAPPVEVREMPEAVKAAFAQCWGILSAEAGRDIAEVRKSCADQLKQLQQQAGETLDACAEFETLTEEQERLIAEIKTDNDEIRAAAAETFSEAEELKSLVEVLRVQLTDAHEFTGHLLTQNKSEEERGCAEVARLSALLQTEQNAREAAERRASDEAEKSSAELARLSASLQTEAADSASLRAQLETNKQRSGETIIRVEEAKARAENEAKRLRAEVQLLQLAAAELNGKLSATETRAAEQGETIKRLTPAKRV